EKKRKKKKKGDKNKVQNDIHLKNYNATLKREKSYTETCDDNKKHLKKKKIRASYLNKEILTSCVPIGNALEVDKGFILSKRKKKKKKKDVIKVQTDKNLKNDYVTLKAEKLYINTCDDNDKYLNKNKTGASGLIKDELTSRVSIANDLEGNEELTLFKKKKKKKRNKKKLDNENATLKIEKSDQLRSSVDRKLTSFCMNEHKKTIHKVDMNKTFNSINMKTSPINYEEYTTKLESLSKKTKKKKEYKIEKKEETKHKNPKKMKQDIYQDQLKKNYNYDKDMINTLHNSKISKVHDVYPKLLYKLSKIQKKEQRKAIKAVFCAETLSPEKSNKRKRLTTDKEYSENNYSVDMDKEAYDSHVRISSEDGRRDHEIEELNNVPSHGNVHIGKSSLSCDICFKIFTNNSKLCRHKKTHTSEKSYARNVCGRSFAKNDILVKHNRTNTGEKPYTCKFCGQSFAQSSTLIDHCKRTHTGEKPYACNVCERSFRTQSDLVVHNRTHTGEKPYACNVCGRSFSLKSSLVKHDRTHTGDKPYACNVCESSFTQKWNLVVHNRTHTGDKPYACNVCESSFTQNSDLIVHYRTHTGEKPYACNVCGRSFTQKWNLVVHNRTHTGDKPYACNVCGRSFTQISTLNNHYRTHTGEKPYECGQCEKKFTTSGNRTRHIRRIHFKCF
ncbi:zinc finger protein 436-like, partial [Rhopalosiphum padi]|uniref:zinc finger protein 436-like n=1 Tax=Rhopalosiphum padi TaxID=40932 RepID=UPI00298DC7A9